MLTSSHFCRNFNKGRTEKAKEIGAMKICTNDHDFLREHVWQRTTLDYEDMVYGEFDFNEGCVSDGEGGGDEKDSEGE